MDNISQKGSYIKAHLVFSPKDRGVFNFRELRGKIKDIVFKVASEAGVRIDSGKFTRDYLYLQVSYPAQSFLENVIHEIKNKSSKEILSLVKAGQDDFWSEKYSAVLGEIVNLEELFKVAKQEPIIPVRGGIRCLVTGGAGFIGSTLADELIKRGYEVSIIDDLSTGKESYINPKAKFYKVDICDREAVKDVFAKEKFDYVFHLAAQIDVRISVANPALDNKINVLGSLNILESAYGNGVKKILFSSTGGAIYGETESGATSEGAALEPLSPYGINKLAFEKLLFYYHKVYGQEYIALRLANVYGPRQYKGGEAGVVSIFVDHAVNDKKVIINGDGLQTRDFVYVNDVVSGFIKAMDSDHVGEINIGTGVETNLLQIVEAIEKATGRQMEKEFGPAKMGEQKRSCLSFEKAKNILNWQPKMGLEEGIKKTVDWAYSKKQG